MTRDEAVSIADLSKLTNITSATIYNYIEENLIEPPTHRVKGRYYYALNELPSLKYKIITLKRDKKLNKNQKISETMTKNMV